MAVNGVGAVPDALGGAISLSDLFPNAWMERHTEYEDIQTFIDASDAEPTDPASPRWHDHVAAATEFDDWSEMLGHALADYRD